jgi:hypothetical protein
MKIRIAGAATVFTAALLVAPVAMAHGSYGQYGGQGHGSQEHGQGGMMGQGCGGPGQAQHGKMGGQGGMGHGGMMGGQGGMMGQGQGCGGQGGMGQGGMGQGGMGMSGPMAEDISVAGVRNFMQHRLEAMGNPNLKLGEIVEKDEDTITADIVTQDGSLFRSFIINRHTGAMQPSDMVK